MVEKKEIKVKVMLRHTATMGKAFLPKPKSTLKPAKVKKISRKNSKIILKLSPIPESKYINEGKAVIKKAKGRIILPAKCLCKAAA